MNTNETLPVGFQRLGNSGLALGLLGAAATALVSVGHAREFMQSYLFAWIFWMCFALGCYGFMLLHNITRGSWAYPVIRLFEAGAKTLPLMFMLFLPILLTLTTNHLYPWADPNLVRGDKVLQGRSGYMNPTWFAFRTIIYFGIWYFLFTLPLTRWSRLQEETGDRSLDQVRTNLSAPGFVLFVITVTLAVTDWGMSLDKHWYSTIYGFLFVDYMGLAALSFVTLIVTLMARRAPYGDASDTVVTPSVTRDLGNLLLTLTMVWAYFSLSQFLIIWSGNLPQEIGYYLLRNRGLMLFIGAFRILFQFFVPFLLLLSGRNKRNLGNLAAVAVLLLVTRLVDVYWVIMPTMRQPGLAIYISDLTALVALGGVWLFGFVWCLRQRPLLPRRELTVAQEAINHA
jgi:hypothetical protein